MPKNQFLPVIEVHQRKHEQDFKPSQQKEAEGDRLLYHKALFADVNLRKRPSFHYAGSSTTGLESDFHQAAVS